MISSIMSRIGADEWNRRSNEAIARRADLILDLSEYPASALAWDNGGWVADRVYAIRGYEKDLAALGCDFRPFDLASLTEE